MVSELVDDWCATPWPHIWLFPRPVPGPAGPFPDPGQVNTAGVVAATVFASYASRLREGALQVTLAKGAERLAQVAVQC